MVLRDPGQVNVGVGRPCTAGWRPGWRDRHREQMGRATRALESFQTQREEGFPAGERPPQLSGRSQAPGQASQRRPPGTRSPDPPPASLPQTPCGGPGHLQPRGRIGGSPAHSGLDTPLGGGAHGKQAAVQAPGEKGGGLGSDKTGRRGRPEPRKGGQDWTGGGKGANGKVRWTLRAPEGGRGVRSLLTVVITEQGSNACAWCHGESRPSGDVVLRFVPVLPILLSLYRRDMSSQGASVIFMLEQASGRAQPGRRRASESPGVFLACPSHTPGPDTGR